jgi:hypothetical protein
MNSGGFSFGITPGPIPFVSLVLTLNTTPDAPTAINWLPIVGKYACIKAT